MTPRPTVIEQPSMHAVEAARARWWRKCIVKLSRKQLAHEIGYSPSAIGLFEQGYDHRGRVLGERAWRRYRLVCAGFARGAFDWGMTRSAIMNRDIVAGAHATGQAED